MQTETVPIGRDVNHVVMRHSYENVPDTLTIHAKALMPGLTEWFRAPCQLWPELGNSQRMVALARFCCELCMAVRLHRPDQNKWQKCVCVCVGVCMNVWRSRAYGSVWDCRHVHPAWNGDQKYILQDTQSRNMYQVVRWMNFQEYRLQTESAKWWTRGSEEVSLVQWCVTCSWH